MHLITCNFSYDYKDKKMNMFNKVNFLYSYLIQEGEYEND